MRPPSTVPPNAKLQRAWDTGDYMSPFYGGRFTLV